MNQNENFNFAPMTGQPINQQPQRQPMQNQSTINMYSQQPVQPPTEPPTKISNNIYFIFLN